MVPIIQCPAFSSISDKIIAVIVLINSSTHDTDSQGHSNQMKNQELQVADCPAKSESCLLDGCSVAPTGRQGNAAEMEDRMRACSPIRRSRSSDVDRWMPLQHSRHN